MSRPPSIVFNSKVGSRPAADAIGQQASLAVKRLESLVLHLVHAPHLLDEQQRI